MNYKVTAPQYKRNGTFIPKDHLEVLYHRRVPVAWAEMRPIVACAFRHVKVEAIRAHGADYSRRQLRCTHVLRVGLSDRGYWYGHACGYQCRVFVGRLHPEPCKDTYRRYKDMPEYWYRDWKERAVFLFAHELWHRWSQKPNGKQQEFDCEIVGMDAIDRWRREQGYTWIPPLCMAEQ